MNGVRRMDIKQVQTVARLGKEIADRGLAVRGVLVLTVDDVLNRLRVTPQLENLKKT